MENGYFKFYRSILESQVFAHPVALKIWVWCLAKANFRDKYVPFKVGKGTTTIHVKAGQFLFGRFKAEDELGIDGSTIYKWMQRFASEAFEKMITLESNNQYTLVTISNWASYQEEKGSEVTTKEQPRNNDVTTEEQQCNTTNNDNKVKKEKESIKIEDVCPYDQILDLFHSTCMSIPKVLKLSDSRKDKIRLRFNEMEKSFEILKKVFENVEASDFCTGTNDRGWIASFDWIFENDKNWLKIYEGAYSGAKKAFSINDVWDKKELQKHCNAEWE